MEKTIRIASIIILFFNGINALWGGLALIYSPDGSLMQMSPDFIQQTPFRSYLIPGIILFTFNGLTSIAIAIWTIKRLKHYQGLIIMQGAILTGWIIMQIILMRQLFAFLHIPFLIMGIVLICAGLYLHKKSGRNNQTVKWR